MAPDNGTILGVIAQQLLRQLDAYAEAFESAEADPEHLERCADEIDASARLLPGLSVAYTQFIISRAEWIHALWRPRGDAEHAQVLGKAWTQHRGCLDSLRQVTRRSLQIEAETPRRGEGALSALAALVRRRPPQ